MILSFESKVGFLSYPCDTYTDWQANVRAIALALAALRAVDRYGVTRRAEQYKGWARLEAPKPPATDVAVSALRTLCAIGSIEPALTLSLIVADKKLLTFAYQKAVFKSHPDHGGDAELFRQVQEAKAVLDRYLAV